MRGSFLTCPACGGPMGEHGSGDSDDGPRFHSCDACHGVWLDWYGEEASRVARSVPPVPRGGPAGRPGGACPRDGAALVERPYLDSGPGGERCPVCPGLFAPRGQVAPLAALYQRIPPPGPAPV